MMNSYTSGLGVQGFRVDPKKLEHVFRITRALLPLAGLDLAGRRILVVQLSDFCCRLRSSSV